MNALIQDAHQLIGLAGDMWLYALIAAFVVMLAESANPKPADDEERPPANPFGVVAAIASLATPFLLFLHAYVEAARVPMPNALVASLIVLVTAVFAATIIGWIIAAAIRPLGKLLGQVAPFLALAVFAFTVWVTWSNVYEAIDRQVLSRF